MKDLSVIETILRNRYHFFVEIREGISLPEKMRAMLISSIAFLALYGAVMGSTNSLWQVLSSAAKLRSTSTAICSRATTTASRSSTRAASPARYETRRSNVAQRGSPDSSDTERA